MLSRTSNPDGRGLIGNCGHKSSLNGAEEGVRQIKIPLPMEGERLGEGVSIRAFTPSPRPSPSREKESSGRLQ
jgi:hypothetical protein